MQAFRFRICGRLAAIAAAILILCSPHLGLAAIPADLQETPAALVASSERDFDRLDSGAGLRSGGAFPFDYQHLVFFDLDGLGKPVGDVNLWTAASVQAGRLRGIFDDGWNYSMDLTVSLFDADTLVARTEIRHAFVMSSRQDEDVTDGFPIHVLMRVPAGEYDYRIMIRDNNWPDNRSVNEKRGRVVVPRPITTQPFVSSVAIAADSSGSWNPATDVELKLNAARIVQSDRRPYVYFEVYGLTPGSSYRGDLRLVSRWAGRGKGEDFRGTYQPFQLQYRGTVPTDPAEPVRELLRLDLTDTAPGPYEVLIRVRDLETGLVSEVRSARLKVRAPDAFQRIVPIAGVRKDEPGRDGTGGVE